jgi:hypothetical protein
LASQREKIQSLTAALAQAQALAAAAHQSAPLPEHERRVGQLEQEVARLTEDRDRLQAQWAESSQRFTAQIAQLNAEAARLAEEHTAGQAAQDRWLGERQQLVEQVNASDRLLADIQTQLAAATAALAVRQAEVARLTQERSDLQAQWAAANHQLTAQSERAREQAGRLAEQRASFDAQQQRMQAEQRALSEQLAGRSQQVARLEAELAAAAAELAQRASEVEMLKQEKANLLSQSPLALADIERTLVPPAQSGSLHESEQLSDNAMFEEALEDASGALDEAADQPMETLSAIVRSDLPGGRRNKAQRQEEMTTFVGDRLSALDHSHRRRTTLLWVSVAAGTLALSAAIFGAWYFLH